MPGERKQDASALGRFFGRERELETLGRELQRGSRLLTLVAPSGMGKSRLARRLFENFQPAFAKRGGAWACGLAGARQEQDLQAAVARTLDLPLGQPGHELGRALANRGPTLLLLDNLEYGVDSFRDLLQQWMAEAPSLQLLTTSLLPLGLEEETLYELSPLAEDDALALYLDRAAQADAGIAVRLDERSARELVRRLDRIPLAIELAAARARILPPRLFLSQAGRHLSWLRSQRGGRHGSLHGAIAMSWRLLSGAERDMLAKCTVFVGGFSLEAAEEVFRGDAKNPLAVLDSLRSKGLVQLELTNPPRFGLYESIRDFANEQLRRTGREQEAFLRHGGYFVRAAETAAEQAKGKGAREAIRWLLDEQENLLAAHRRLAEIAPESSARIGVALSVAMAIQGPVSTEAELLDGTVGAARRGGDPALLVRALLARAGASYQRGALGEARRDLEEAVGLARREGLPTLEGFGSSTLASTWHRLEEAARSRLAMRRARLLADKTRDPILTGYSLIMQADIWIDHGKVDEAIEILETSIRTLRAQGHLRFVGLGLITLGFALSSQDRLQEARRITQEARLVFRQLGHRASEAVATLNLGGLMRLLGRLDEAERLCLDGLATQRSLGNRRYEALALGNLGLISLERQDPRLAADRLQAASDIFRDLGEDRIGAVCLAFLAVAQSHLGKHRDARASLDAAGALVEGPRDTFLFRTLEILDGLLLLAKGSLSPFDELREELRRRLVIARRHLDDARRRPDGDGTFGSLQLATRLLERVLGARPGGDASPEASAARGKEGALLLCPDLRWFQPPSGERVSLHRRKVLRRILQGLVDQRLLAPGVELPHQNLVQIAWPDEKLLPRAAANRVRTSIFMLRQAGLAEILLRTHGGYLLDPKVEIRWVGEGGSPPERSADTSSRTR